VLCPHRRRVATAAYYRKLNKAIPLLTRENEPEEKQAAAMQNRYGRPDCRLSSWQSIERGALAKIRATLRHIGAGRSTCAFLPK
jgi:hypothetical protein